MKWTASLLTLLFVATVWAATPAPEGARAYIISPVDGDTVTSPVTVQFGLENMGVAPAGVEFENTGHHHLVINAELPPLMIPVPTSENYVHFGLGQTQAEIELPPGEHTLQMILGDHLHMPHDPAIVSEQITITVVEPE